MTDQLDQDIGEKILANLKQIKDKLDQLSNNQPNQGVEDSSPNSMEV